MASRGINKVIVVELYQSGKSIPQISEKIGAPLSTVRYHLMREGVLRSRTEGVRMAAKEGRIGEMLRGNKRIFTELHKQNISKSKLEHADVNASGMSLKPSGYVEVTRGNNKGRGLHRVIAEMVIGRPLTKGEVVHHIDGNRSNNDPINLQVMTISDHCRHHAIERNSSRQRNNLGRYI